MEPNTPTFDPKEHWENIHQVKDPLQVSWYQSVPEVSLRLIEQYGGNNDARVIDVGGGDSRLVDHLLDRGYSKITVLDISGNALHKAKQRLGVRQGTIRWIEADATRFTSYETFDVWHDRAVFHFLTDDDSVERYMRRVSEYLVTGGLLILGTFSENGPEKCSGIPVHRYNEAELVERMQRICDRIDCFTIDHITPSEKAQNFLFCAFRKLS